MVDTAVEILSSDEEFAQWVQCVSCGKWRELLETEDIYLINRATWVCSERADLSCEIYEEKNKWWNSKCTYQQYHPGDLVAVKVDG